MTGKPSAWHSGALTGLALLVATTGFGDEVLRDEIHRTYGQQSYMLIEHADGATLYLFDKTTPDAQVVAGRQDDFVAAALAKTQSTDARVRARGLAELAGVDGYEVLSTGLSLLADPDPAVRDEAKYLVLDHPRGAEIAAALGLVDDELEE